MRKLILGRLGVGKTLFLVNQVIPKLDDYLVFDFCNEYKSISPEIKSVQLMGGGSTTKEQVAQIVSETSKHTTLIFDNAGLLYFPKREKYTVIDSGYDWLIEIIGDRHCVMVFQSARQFCETYIREHFTEITLFPTRDIPDNDTSFEWLMEQVAKGKKVGYMQHFSSDYYKPEPHYL